MSTTTISDYGNLIGGEFTRPQETFENLNPADWTDIVGRFPVSSTEDVDAAVDSAERTYPSWRATPAPVRGKYLLKIAQWLRDHTDEIILAITREEGKPLSDSRGELAKSADTFEYYGALSLELGGRTLPSSRPGVGIFTKREPVGVVALITPWNVPIVAPARKLAPALVCGNTAVIKPSQETPLSAHLLVQAAMEAGLPPGVVNLIHGPGSTVGRALVADSRVKGISFTGSTEVGRELAMTAGQRLARIQLELGGKNASVVLDDCDLDLAVEQIVLAAYSYTGQQCTATSRVIVERSVADAFQRMAVDRVRAFQVGNGADEATDLGPMVSERQLRTALNYIDVGRREGAALLTGGSRLTGGAYERGWFMEPAVFGRVHPGMRIAREEIFGPVLSLIEVDDDDQAMQVANDSQYGLSAAVYTRSLARTQRFVDGLEAGAVAVNLPSAGWELQTPFGGFKASGTGAKEQGTVALDFYSELKAVQVWGGR